MCYGFQRFSPAVLAIAWRIFDNGLRRANTDALLASAELASAQPANAHAVLAIAQPIFDIELRRADAQASLVRAEPANTQAEPANAHAGLAITHPISISNFAL